MAHMVDFAGVWKGHERIINLLDPNKFETFVLYWDNQDEHTDMSRLEIAKRELPSTMFIPYSRSLEKKQPAWTPVSTNFSERFKGMFDIIHYVRSGYPEWPFTERLAPLQIETNIFADLDETPYLDKSMAVCNYIADRRGKIDAVVYPPMRPAITEGSNFREELGLNKDTVVFGKIGRPDSSLFTPIALDAFNQLYKSGRHDIAYLSFAPCEKAKQYVKDNDIQKVYFLPPSSHTEDVDKFYRTLDVFAHYRLDGECQSTAIAEAMMYGLPCISHPSHAFNGQGETIGGGGFIAATPEEYCQRLRELLDPEVRRVIGGRAYKRAMNNYEETLVGKQLEALYLKWHTEVE